MSKQCNQDQTAPKGKDQFDQGLHCLPFQHNILGTSSGSYRLVKF